MKIRPLGLKWEHHSLSVVGANVFRDVLPTVQQLKVLPYYIENWDEFLQRNT
jgi:hypothetical protein